jgi:nicotinate-nucleotide adenylyltransferase
VGERVIDVVVRPRTAIRPGSIGIMGGTFDPIHIAHLAAAEEAHEALGFERVLFIPAGIPPLKPGRRITPAADRVAMVELAIAANPAFELSRIEVDRPGMSYTVDTVALLAESEEAAGQTPDITLIVSGESLRSLPLWHEPHRLLELCRLAVVPRDGFATPDRTWIGTEFPGCEDRIVYLDAPRLRLSATEIRARVAAGRSIRYLVPDAVIGYIGDHDLYTNRQGPTDE